ncbi:unnamed protein product [Schistocephalus solidus]|uniref:Uncharacterized protein n=1 Tax=Schistocephalus solidus TaxID=70667 RepID=A0A183SRL9_SCHSO|nr:unnamed protein product [Schistocephalus solidus]
MQMSMDIFAAGCADFGLIINTANTVVMHQPPPSAEYNAPRINVNGAQLKNVETFAYLGSTLSRNTRINDEVDQRISKASYAFGRLQASVWNRYAAPRILAGSNGCYLLDNPKGTRLEWRTGLVTRELACYEVDIAALSETRFSKQGQLE